MLANWKMHGSPELCLEFASHMETFEGIDIGIAPPSLFVHFLQSLPKRSFIVGVQNIHAEQSGAYTGEVSTTMAQQSGASFAIVGHSERRALFHESDADVAAKVLACCEVGIAPILCVGETLEQRNEGLAKEIVSGQVESVLQTCGAKVLSNADLAYEPVWAIGTGVVATPGDAMEIHDHLRSMICDALGASGSQMRILYGGSVKPDNAADLIAQENIDGFLVGGSSLDVQSFNEICATVAGR